MNVLSLRFLQPFVGRCIKPQGIVTCRLATEAMRNQPPQTNSFVMNIFRGQACLSEVFPYPKVLSDERRGILQCLVDPVQKFAENELTPATYDEEKRFPDELMNDLKEMGAFGLQTPEDFGGVGLNNSEYARMVSVLGTKDLALGIVLGAHQSIGYKGILLYGTPQQKKKYLPSLASGEKIAAFCLTETDAGSDAAAVQTKATLSADGKYYSLTGSKIWISNAGIADVFTVFAKVPLKEADGSVKEKMTAFIVERGFGGVTHGPPEDKMGIKASNTGSLFFENTKVPVENVLGEVGSGFKVAVNILNQGRFGMAAALSGTMRSAIAQATEHAASRKQFGQTLDHYQSIEEKLVNMAICQYTTESIGFMLSGIMDLGAKDFQLEAAISKVYSSEAAWYCVDEAIQILGGMGFMRSAGLERVLRDLRVFRIFEGANDVLRLFIAGTGCQFAGKHLAAASKSASGVLGMAGGRISRALHLTGNSRAIMAKLPPELNAHGRMLGDAIDAFGGVTESLLLKYKKGIIEEQCRLLRLADMAIQIYGTVCNLSRVSTSLLDSRPSADYELKLLRLASNTALTRIERSLTDISSKAADENYRMVKGLTKDLVAAKGVVQQTPLGF
uniref:Very long-chain specific acyl-CoA dehydrogenase, mitochondrial n=1 Tax=Schistocephalus solidus TaxID=70667 RepID=A0A0V0J9D5_SCHSO